jgi:hypothetical protein
MIKCITFVNYHKNVSYNNLGKLNKNNKFKNNLANLVFLISSSNYYLFAIFYLS